MTKNCCLLLLLVFIVASCKNDEPGPAPVPKAPTTSADLTYPMGIGSSGDSINGLLGYGYDATGFCDTISVRAKVLESLPNGDTFHGNPNSTFPTLISGASFTELTNKINNPNLFSESGTALVLHLKSLLKLATKSDSINPNYAFTYYAATYINSHRKFYYGADVQKYVTSTFKNDIAALSAQELVAKYGTHILNDVYTGTRFEVLYRCRFASYSSESNCEQLFYNRMKQYMGGVFGIYDSTIGSNTALSQTSEQLIYNSGGSSKKLCGVINASDYNPDSIRVDVGQIFNSKNLKTQFISIGTDGILPLYELISDATKKQEVKTYIEKYMSASSVK